MDSRPIGETIAASPVVANMQSGLSNLQSSASNIGSSITDTVSGIKDSVSSKLGEFSAPQSLGETGTSEFASSNGLIAKFVFLILVLVVFVALLNTGIYLITQWNKPDRSPYLVKGMQDGNRAKTITQDPRNSNSKTVYRSNNASKGIEFTWSVWLNLTDMPTGQNTVFIKGTGSNNAPGVYVDKETDGTAKLIIKMDDSNSTTQSIPILNIPVKRWFHIAIRQQNKIMDVYMNGTIAKRYTFENLPKQNYDDIRIAPDNGFTGKLSNLRYFDSALNVFQITNIAMAGPNLTNADDAKDTKFDYLSSSWYSKNA